MYIALKILLVKGEKTVFKTFKKAEIGLLVIDWYPVVESFVIYGNSIYLYVFHWLCFM